MYLQSSMHLSCPFSLHFTAHLQLNTKPVFIFNINMKRLKIIHTKKKKEKKKRTALSDKIKSALRIFSNEK